MHEPSEEQQHQAIEQTLLSLQELEPRLARNSQGDLADFELIRVLGEGGFGKVWLGRNFHDNQLYAVKIYSEDNTAEIAGISEYKKRARSNPFLVSIWHVGNDNGQYYYTMQLADHAFELNVVDLDSYEPLTLERYVSRRGQLEPQEVTEVSRNLLLGLEHLHNSGLAHCDLKPSNVLRIDGVWKLGDPGLATQLEANASGGTRGFRPETLVDSGKQKDLFALGATMSYMLTGSTDPTAEEAAASSRCSESSELSGPRQTSPPHGRKRFQHRS